MFDSQTSTQLNERKKRGRLKKSLEKETKFVNREKKRDGVHGHLENQKTEGNNTLMVTGLFKG